MVLGEPVDILVDERIQPLAEVTSKRIVAALSGDSQAIPSSVSSGFQESGMSTEIAGLSSGTFTVPAGARLVSRREKARAAQGMAILFVVFMVFMIFFVDTEPTKNKQKHDILLKVDNLLSRAKKERWAAAGPAMTTRSDFSSDLSRCEAPSHLLYRLAAGLGFSAEQRLELISHDIVAAADDNASDRLEMLGRGRNRLMLP